MLTSTVRDRLICAAALVVGVAPLWVTWQLPVVDLPQHLHLISALHRLGDPTTLYPQFFERRAELTPYLGYYYLVGALNWLFPLELANRLFLTAYVVAVPLSLLALLRALGRPGWPALLALPAAYGDSFAWGFVNFCSAVPLGFTSCALFVLALKDAARRRLWAGFHAAALCAVLLFHVQVFAFLALALPWLLALVPAPFTPSLSRGSGSLDSARDERFPTSADAPNRVQRWLRPRWAALASVVPGCLLFLVWVVGRAGQPTAVEVGAPWKAWGPMLSAQNLAYKPFAQNLDELWSVLANALRDGSDRSALWAVVVVAAFGAVLGGLDELSKPTWAALRSWMAMLGLVAAALLLFFTLPFDIRGYIYYLNTRYAHVAAALLVAALPAARPSWRPPLIWATAAAVAWFGLTLARGYAHFDEEAGPLRTLAADSGQRQKVMGLMFDSGSRIVNHPVFLHSACEVARAGGGLTNFSFALTPHSPLRYRVAPPPTFPSEWRPDQFDWASMAPAYDLFLLRGAPPDRIPALAAHLAELETVGQAGGFWLVRRR